MILRYIEFYRLFHKLRDFWNRSQVKILILFYILVRHSVAYSYTEHNCGYAKALLSQTNLPASRPQLVDLFWRPFPLRLISLHLLRSSLHPFHRAFCSSHTWYNGARGCGESSISQRMETQADRDPQLIVSTLWVILLLVTWRL